MACCHQATSHYLNQCWLIISESYGSHLKAISQGMLKVCFLGISLKIYSCKIFTAASPRSQWVNPCGAEFFWENIKIYLHFPSFLDTEMVWIVEILLDWYCSCWWSGAIKSLGISSHVIDILWYFFWNITVSAPEGLTLYVLNFSEGK